MKLGNWAKKMKCLYFFLLLLIWRTKISSVSTFNRNHVAGKTTNAGNIKRIATRADRGFETVAMATHHPAYV